MLFNDNVNATRGGHAITGSALSHRPRPSLFDPLAIASLAIAPLALAPLALAPLATPSPFCRRSVFRDAPNAAAVPKSRRPLN